jgi:hypothetical protein
MNYAFTYMHALLCHSVSLESALLQLIIVAHGPMLHYVDEQVAAWRPRMESHF